MRHLLGLLEDGRVIRAGPALKQLGISRGHGVKTLEHGELQEAAAGGAEEVLKESRKRATRECCT